MTHSAGLGRLQLLRATLIAQRSLRSRAAELFDDCSIVKQRAEMCACVPEFCCAKDVRDISMRVRSFHRYFLPGHLQDSKALEPAAAGKPERARGKRKARGPAPWSALDGLWAALRDAPRLRAERPAVLAAALHTLLALFQVGLGFEVG